MELTSQILLALLAIAHIRLHIRMRHNWIRQIRINSEHDASINWQTTTINRTFGARISEHIVFLQRLQEQLTDLDTRLTQLEAGAISLGTRLAAHEQSILALSRQARFLHDPGDAT